IAGICLVRRGRPGLGGFALTWSALLRIFPAFIVVALLLKYAVVWVRERRVTVPAELKRFGLGCAAAALLLVPPSLALTPGGAALRGGGRGAPPPGSSKTAGGPWIRRSRTTGAGRPWSRTRAGPASSRRSTAPRPIATAAGRRRAATSSPAASRSSSRSWPR